MPHKHKRRVKPELWLELVGLVLFLANAPFNNLGVEIAALAILTVSTLMDMFG